MSNCLAPLVTGCVVAVSAVALPSALAQGEPKPDRTGRYTVRFTERDPRSSVGEANRRFGHVRFKPAERTLDLGSESFEVRVPQSYDGTEPFGLIAWINAGDRGGIPRQYEALMDKYRLIWVGANKSGNDRKPPWIRAMLAIDGVFNMKRLYKIDPDRIYVSGVSGGGRMSSMVAPSYPDVFTGGGYYIIGCNYTKHIPVGGNKYYPGFWPRPDGRIIAVAKMHRYVMITGSTDFNKPGTERVYAAYRKDGFRHVTYLEEPGLGHALPSAEWYEKGLVVLDKPLIDAAVEPKPREPKLVRPRNPPTAPTLAYRKWTSGKYSTEARLIVLVDGVAVLKKPDGSTIRVPCSKLSPADQRFLDDWRKRK